LRLQNLAHALTSPTAENEAEQPLLAALDELRAPEVAESAIDDTVQAVLVLGLAFDRRGSASGTAAATSTDSSRAGLSPPSRSPSRRSCSTSSPTSRTTFRWPSS
jgi:hypothetical protein